MLNIIIKLDEVNSNCGTITLNDASIDFSISDGILDVDYFNIIEATIENYDVDIVVNAIQNKLHTIFGDFR